MFFKSLKFALRGLAKNKFYSLINIIGLALGIACCLIIMLYVHDDFSYDKYNQHYKDTYILSIDGIINNVEKKYPITNPAAAATMQKDFPEIQNFVRVDNLGKILIKNADDQLYEDDVVCADNSIFDIFTYKFIYGSPANALTDANTVVLTESLSKKLFGDIDPVGKVINVDNAYDCQVRAVVADLPHNSHFPIKMLISYQTMNNDDPNSVNNWYNFNQFTYLLLKPGTDPHLLEQKFPAFIEKYMKPGLQKMGVKLAYFLVPLKDIHLYSDFDMNVPSSGNIIYTYIFLGIAILILAIASFNFINLSTARSLTRAREVGVRKAIGASRGKLIRQFLAESLLITLIATVIALVFLEIASPLFNSLSGRELSINYFNLPFLILIVLGIIFAVGLIAGIYPALLLSSFRPVEVLKGSMFRDKTGVLLRRILVGLQFVISIMLIVGALTIYRQVDYVKNVNLGFNGEQVLVIGNLDDSVRKSMGPIITEFKNTPGVLDVSVSDNVPGEFCGKAPVIPEGKSAEQSQLVDVMFADYDFLNTMGIELAAGRNFSPEITSDSSSAIILNETAVREFGWDDALGKIIMDTQGNEFDSLISRKVIGVIKDFHMMSLHDRIDPMCIILNRGNQNYISIKLSGKNIASTMKSLQDTWKRMTKGYPFEYDFLNVAFNNLYDREIKLAQITLLFSILAIIIGCLGLLGLTAYVLERRVKEIAIRKVLGASEFSIVSLFSREFAGLVMAASLIAWPLSYYFLNRWLSDFAYRINLTLPVFITASTIALAIALATTMALAFNAALANPVKSIRTE